MSRTVLTLAVLAVLVAGLGLGTGTAQAGDRTRVVVHTADWASGNHAVLVQKVHHPHYRAYDYYGGPVVAYPPVYPAYPVPMVVAPAPHRQVVYPVMGSRSILYYSAPRFSLQLGF